MNAAQKSGAHSCSDKRIGGTMFSEDFTKESESHEIFTKESLQVSYG